MRCSLILLLFIAVCAGEGCASGPVDEAVVGREVQDCPDSLKGQITLSGSAAIRTVPALFSTVGTSVDRDVLAVPGPVARRVLISISPGPAMRQWRLVSSRLTLNMLGGSLKGWADLDPPRSARSHALEVIPGRLRLSPVAPGGRLKPQSLVIDLLIAPGGGVPIDEMVITEPTLWNEQLEPTAAESVQLTLVPVHRPTVYTQVDTHMTLDVMLTSVKAPHELYACSFESLINVVDHDSVRPPLWDMGAPGRSGGPRQLWLALYDRSQEAFRAVFTTPAVANGFAAWLKKTHAVRVGKYQLGVFQQDEVDRLRQRVPQDRTILESFRPITAAEIDALRVGAIAEP
ncbi:MAG TPA: hypothetical protein VGM84_15815 [Steroidobacteraceae bacterium]|jgi:hypothetical protein